MARPTSSLVGKRLQMDLSELQPNQNGIALVALPTDTGAPSYGQLAMVDVRTGKVQECFTYVSGNSRITSDMQRHGPFSGHQTDLNTHPDVQAQVGVFSMRDRPDRTSWEDGAGRQWGVDIGTPVNNRGLFRIHPSSNRGNGKYDSTYGCFGVLAEEATAFYDRFNTEGGFPNLTLAAEEVTQRTAASRGRWDNGATRNYGRDEHDGSQLTRTARQEAQEAVEWAPWWQRRAESSTANHAQAEFTPSDDPLDQRLTRGNAQDVANALAKAGVNLDPDGDGRATMGELRAGLAEHRQNNGAER